MAIPEYEQKMSVETVKGIYEAAYQERYRVKPVYQNLNADQTIIKDLVRAHGLDAVCEAVRTYLKMNNEWFLEKAHSLKVLQDNYARVHVEVGKRPKRETHKVNPNNMASPTRCDTCGSVFQLVWNATDGFPLPPYHCVNCTCVSKA